jgi:hypothetical protein
MSSVAFFVSLLAFAAPPDLPDDIWQNSLDARLSSINLPATVLGEGWEESAGLVIDDFDDLASLTEPERRAAEQLKVQLTPVGIRACADFSLNSTKLPPNIVVVRVFLFDTPEQCRDWWKKKYQHEGWEKFYKPVEHDSRAIVDSTETNKRAIAFGSIWLTTHQLGQGGEHLKAAEHVIQQLTATAAGARPAGERRIDQSEGFAYVLPEGWKRLETPQFKHDVILLPVVDGRNRNIIINDQPGNGRLQELKESYERDLAKQLKGFTLVSSQIVDLRDGEQALRLIDTNTAPGVPVRQVNYIVTIGVHRYFVTCTAMKSDEDKYDRAFEDFVKSMSAVEK